MIKNDYSGYTYGTEDVAQSPLTMEDFYNLKKTIMFGPEDERYLRMAGEVLADQVEDVLDVWYGFVAANPHLLYYFSDNAEHPVGSYLDAVRKRFGQWILDTCNRSYDGQWLDYQQEIGLRHTRAKKNHSADDVEKMHQAWFKSVVLQVALWSQPYIKEGDF